MSWPWLDISCDKSILEVSQESLIHQGNSLCLTFLEFPIIAFAFLLSEESY